MATYTWSSAFPNPSSVQITLATNDKISRSPLTGDIQTATRQGSRWSLVMTWENVTGNPRAYLYSMIHRLMGTRHRVKIPVSTWNHQNIGAFGGSPLVAGANQTGQTLDLDGVTSPVSDWIFNGDFISIEDNLYQSLGQYDTASGSLSIAVMPDLLSPADNAVIETDPASVYGTFMLVGNPQFDNRDVLRSGDLVSTVTAEFLQDFV